MYNRLLPLIEILIPKGFNDKPDISLKSAGFNEDFFILAEVPGVARRI